MSKFSFTARNNRDQIVTGEITATSENDAVLKVEKAMADTNRGEAETVTINGNTHTPSLTRMVENNR
ncbi:hypothetical protein [Streptomyces flaveolus]|uniref:hypothetical protein n=1 Tax=Streptomyces flaveolus TaxID=67297 RepID=UPI001670136B|nr:hypothetical protein [Streptomyces flaveolus]GGQ83674.1 hypothetical protein GCM10010216_51910 [Streptomyces flaveolus]